MLIEVNETEDGSLVMERKQDPKAALHELLRRGASKDPYAEMKRVEAATSWEYHATHMEKCVNWFVKRYELALEKGFGSDTLSDLPFEFQGQPHLSCVNPPLCYRRIYESIQQGPNGKLNHYNCLQELLWKYIEINKHRILHPEDLRVACFKPVSITERWKPEAKIKKKKVVKAKSDFEEPKKLSKKAQELAAAQEKYNRVQKIGDLKKEENAT